MTNRKKFNIHHPWIKSIGIGAFLFFLLKGIAWLLIGWYVLK